MFLSWSGAESHKVALSMRDWLPSVLPFVEPWVSSEDITKGQRWSAAISSELETCKFCIVCVTPLVAHEPWVNFEAGAIAKVVSESHVSPLLVGTSLNDLGDLPLSMFQVTKFEHADVLRLLESVNSVAEVPLAPERLQKNFELCWPGLQKEIDEILQSLDLSAASTDDFEDDEDVSLAIIDEPEEKILKLVAEMGKDYPDCGFIAGQIGENETRAQYYIDRLLKSEHLHGLYSMMSPARYMTTESGRAYLVENDLL